MNTLTRTSSRHPGHYVHKLRLEAHEDIDISRPLEPTPRSFQGGWILAKFVGATLVAMSLLILIAGK